ncbi:UPF0565 protein C2orf69 homolog [Lingula anatina]|uniref:UPF0565 protein C2orf69 homolog n=1 Tax=Lingula anatina TaxID=7574 RepID=A0A1S3IG69_LINAN|nr:UPF0565 protein C2orf69 homolog [Lingula anatina]|eukprot:XP_013396861.1 UPF0565 protein C2orf69 homolog [Lingula anatina]
MNSNLKRTFLRILQFTACFSTGAVVKSQFTTSKAFTFSMANFPSCHRLIQIHGEDDRKNDIIFCGDIRNAVSHIIFFGGDVQDYPENMLAHRDNKHHIKWSLEATAKLLYQKHPNSAIWVIKPANMYIKTFSSFSNFVDCSEIGVPSPEPTDHGAFRHLQKLFLMGVLQAYTIPAEETHATCPSDNASSEPHPAATTLPISVVGFSKGCVVLNQLLFELQAAKADPELGKFVSQVQSMYWLDGGHNGGSKTWVTDRTILSSLVGTNIEVHVHVTPYQINDPMRKWIGKEEKKFVEELEKLGVKVKETVHFKDEPRSIENHFRVLEEFGGRT